jgi:hypothetical protein
VRLEDTGLALDEVLGEVVDARYGEANGYDPDVLEAFLAAMGFREITPWARIDGAAFARTLTEEGVIYTMPDDIRAVSRALVTSIPRLSRPSTIVTCRAP